MRPFQVSSYLFSPVKQAGRGLIMRWEMGLGAEHSVVEVSGSLTLGTTDLAAQAAAAGAGLAYVEAREAGPFIASGQLVSAGRLDQAFRGHGIVLSTPKPADSDIPGFHQVLQATGACDTPGGKGGRRLEAQTRI